MNAKCCQCGGEAAKFMGRRWLCLVHYRIECMIDCARSSGKTVPTATQFAALVEKALARGMRCEHCDRKMLWFSPENRKSVVTLQHDRSGLIRLLCMSCNSRHATYPGDTFYIYPSDWKWCPACSTAKPLDGFFKAATAGKKCRAMSYCRVCRARFQREGFSTRKAVAV